MSNDFSHDVFISHATEDKDRFVRPLANALRSHGVTVWYDEWELAVGDPLIEKINDGLSRSRFGVVVLSPSFFDKNWSRAELQAFAAIEMRQNRTLLLPVWLDLGADDIAQRAPLLLGRVALMAADGADAVAEKLAVRIKDGEDARQPKTPPPTLEPPGVLNQSLPHMYDPPLASDEQGFVFRTAIALRIPLAGDAHLTSQHKRAFQAILSDSSFDRIVGDLLPGRPGRAVAHWTQVQPNTGTAVTVARTQETMASGGHVDARSGLHLPVHGRGTVHAIVHMDVVLRPPADMTSQSLLSLADFYSLLRIPAASARDEVAPVVTAQLAGSDETAMIAQSVVALPNRSDFATYMDLSHWAGDRVADATGPTAVHWTAHSAGEIDSPDSWNRTVIKMIDRLFSDGSFLDYERALESLHGP